jgi:uncharacterized protein
MRSLLLLILAPLAGVVVPPAGHAASFDCARAAAPDERAVCADPRLSELDDALGKANAEARASSGGPEAAKLGTVARGILADRRSCGTAWGCLVGVYVGGLQSYQRFGSAVPIPDWVTAMDIAQGRAPESGTLPAKPGQCATTQVASITSRLEGEPPGSFDSGTAINFANGGHQVSYEREPALIASRRGDRVVMCLTVIPRACPPGDDRGRYYTVTNLRTRASWCLPGSQHLCGGA